MLVMFDISRLVSSIMSCDYNSRELRDERRTFDKVKFDLYISTDVYQSYTSLCPNWLVPSKKK